MKRFFLCTCLLCTCCLVLTAQKSADVAVRWLPQPLQPVIRDSIDQSDFFWNDAYEEARLIDSVTAYIPPKMPLTKPKQLSRLAAEWEKRLPQLNLVGGIGPLTPHAGSQAKEAIRTIELSWPLFLATGDVRYMDVMERALYNNLRTAVRTETDPETREKAANLIKGVHTMAYATAGKHLYINMYMRGIVHTRTDSLNLDFSQMNSWPWSNSTIFYISPRGKDKHAIVHLRIPGWMRNEVMPGPDARFAFTNPTTSFVVTVNGEETPANIQNGYLVVDKVWDEETNFIKVVMRTPIMRIRKTEHNKDVRGEVAFQRGPLIYCLTDSADGYYVNAEKPIDVNFDRENRKVIELTVKRYLHKNTPADALAPESEMKLIPYFRGFSESPGCCTVWFTEPR